MARYTDEQLSRILGEHAAGTLMHGGWYGWAIDTSSYPRCCVNQAALNNPDASDAAAWLPRAANWFDCSYDRHMSPEDLLEALASA